MNISSLGGIRPWAEHAHYCASKAGVIMLTRALAKALAPEITVNSVAPGVIPFDDIDERAKRMIDATPARRGGTPAEVADAVLYFLKATNFITGQVLFQVLFQLFHVYVPSLNIGGSMLITYLVFTGFRLAFQENLQWRSLKQAQYLRELDQMKSNFLSLVSHDLKTPLAKIQAVTERLRRELALPPSERSDWKELLDSIENSNNELKHYITSLLNLSKIESQKVILKALHRYQRAHPADSAERLRPLAVREGTHDRRAARAAVFRRMRRGSHAASFHQPDRQCDQVQPPRLG